MSDDTGPAQAAELASLRRQVRALALLLAGTAVLAGISLWRTVRAPAAPAPEERVLVGRSLYLRHDPEQPFVRLRYFQDGAGLILADEQGRGQVHLKASPSGGRLALGSGPPGLVLDGLPARASLTLCDAAGRQRIALTGGQTPAVALLDERGRVRLRLSTAADGAELSLRDASGRVRALWSQRGDAVVLKLLDRRGREVFTAPAGPGR
jgi:hypothetical protein